MKKPVIYLEKTDMTIFQELFRKASQAAELREDLEAYKIYKSIDGNPKWEPFLTKKIRFSLYLNLGVVSKRLENYPEAISWYNRCYECAESVDEFLMVVKSRGKILYIIGEKEQAIEDYQGIMVEYYRHLERKNVADILEVLVETQIPYHLGASQVEEEFFAKEYRKSLLGLPSNINDDKAHEVLFSALDQIIVLAGEK